MDVISYSHSAKQAQRIKKFINDPDSTSGVVTTPKVIASGESVTIPAGRVAVLPNVQVDGTLNIQGDVFIPAGATFDDLESQIALKADTSYVNNKYSGFKNYIINGNFDIWQRGNGPFTNYTYGADRWLIYNSPATMYSSSTGTNGIQKRIAHIQNVTAGNIFLAQAIELPLVGFGHPFVVGKKFTLSVRYSSSTKIRPGLVFRDGVVGANPVNLDSTMTSPLYKGGSGEAEIVTWTFTVNGTAASTNTCLVLSLESESNASNVYMYQVQLEEGSVATPFEVRPVGLELSLCQRYYQSGDGVIKKHSTSEKHMGTQPLSFPYSMRVSPTLSFSKIGIITGANALSYSTSSNRLNIHGGSDYSSAAVGDYTYFSFTASAEL